MVDHSTQETYNRHRNEGGEITSFKRIYPHLSETDFKEMEKEWKQEEKMSKRSHKIRN